MPAPGDQHLSGANASITANPFDPPPTPRMSEYTARQIATLQSRLEKQLGPEYISTRPGPGGQRVHYLASEKCIGLANEIFGFNGWSSQIQNVQIDFADEFPSGKISVGLSVIVRVTLKDGTFHEDIGYGQIENSKSKAAAFEKAKKEGTTDALKRALRSFGNVLGNCIYDKDYLSKVTKVKAIPNKKWDVENLHRHSTYAPKAKSPKAEPKEPAANIVEDVKMKDFLGDSFSDAEDDFDGGDVFDVADFAESNDRLVDGVTLPAEQPPRPASTTARAPGRPVFETPSKPERQNNAPLPKPQANQPGQQKQNGSAQVQQARTNLPNNQPQHVFQAGGNGNQPLPQQARAAPLPQNGSRPVTRASAPVTRQQAGQPVQSVPQPALPTSFEKPNQSAARNNANGNGGASTTSTPSLPSDDNDSKAMVPPDFEVPPVVGFFSARAAEKFVENPAAAASAATGALAFNPNADSPSIRKTAGFDHRRSAPIHRKALVEMTGNGNDSGPGNPPTMSRPPTTTTAASPLNANQNANLPGHNPNASYQRNFVNPAQDPYRRIGAPANGSHFPHNQSGNRPPLQSTTSYKPPSLKRPSDGPITNSANATSAAAQSGRKTPLSDVTNIPSAVPLPGHGGNDVKRQRLSGGGVGGGGGTGANASAAPPQ